MTATYGPRVDVHPDRYGANRLGAEPMIHYIIGHTSEQSGAEDPNDAEDLAQYLESPGDRPSSSRPGQFYGASYHAITDTDRILPATEDHLVAYAAGGGNRYGLHICLPVRASQSRQEWLTGESRDYIRQFAEYIVDKSNQYGLPIRWITDAQMAAGSWGYADHWTVTRAYGKSTHTDLGAGFPWDVLTADVAEIEDPSPPPTDPGDNSMILIQPAAAHFRGGLFTVEGQPVSPELLAYLAADAAVVQQDHPHWDAATWAKMGSEARALYNKG